MTATYVVGKRLPKLDAPDKAAGRATYGHDVRLPGMLHGRILYSAHPHARVLHVDVTLAASLPAARASRIDPAEALRQE